MPTKSTNSMTQSTDSDSDVLPNVSTAFPSLSTWMPSPPTFPTIQELAEQDLKAQLAKVPEADCGLFQTMLHGSVDTMHQDSVDYPEKYSDEARQLLQALVNEHRKPTGTEREVLDAAVLDYARKQEPAPRAQPLAPVVAHDNPNRDFSAPQAELPDLPDEETSAPFWWETAQ